jgi:hypothetical protein
MQSVPITTNGLCESLFSTLNIVSAFIPYFPDLESGLRLGLWCQDTDYRDSPDTVFDNGEDLSAEEEAMEEDLTPEQVPGVEGVSENNPYGCQFCTKAFPRLSNCL